MGLCKEDVFEMIDEAIKVHQRDNSCDCLYSHLAAGRCNYCKIDMALKTARACIVQGADELDLLKVRFIGVQEAIEDKLRAILKSGGNGGREVPEDD